MGSVDAFRALVDALGNDATAAALGAIHAQVREPPKRAAFVEAGGMDKLGAIISGRSDELEVLKAALDLLLAAADLSPPARRAVGEVPGLLSSVVDLLDTYQDDPEVLGRALGCLWNSTVFDDQNRDLTTEKGCISKACHLLDRFPEHYCTSINAVGLLWNLTGVPETNSVAVDSGVLPNLMKVFELRKAQAGAMEPACGLALNLLRPSPTCELAKETGLLMHVLDALREHVGTKAVVTNAVTAACLAMAEDPAQRAICEATDGVPLLVAALTNYPAAPHILTNACGAIWNAIVDHDDNAHAAVEAGAITKMCKAMETYPHEALLVRHASGALWNATRVSDTAKLQIAESGGSAAILLACMTYVDDATFMEPICGVLSNIFGVAPVRTLLLDADGLVALQIVLNKHKHNAYITNIACCALYNACADSVHGRDAFVGMGGMELITSCWLEHPDKPFVKMAYERIVGAAGPPPAPK